MLTQEHQQELARVSSDAAKEALGKDQADEAVQLMGQQVAQLEVQLARGPEKLRNSALRVLRVVLYRMEKQDFSVRLGLWHAQAQAAATEAYLSEQAHKNVTLAQADSRVESAQAANVALVATNKRLKLSQVKKFPM